MSPNSISSLPAHAGEEHESSAWADHALATLGRGAMSVSELQQSAAAMVKECRGNCSSMTRAIAQLGCHGRYPANCERDLFRLLELPIASSHLLWVYVLISTSRNSGIELYAITTSKYYSTHIRWSVI